MTERFQSVLAFILIASVILIVFAFFFGVSYAWFTREKPPQVPSERKMQERTLRENCKEKGGETVSGVFGNYVRCERL